MDGAFAHAARVFEDSYRTQMVHQASLEGRVAIAEIEFGGRVHVTSSHQYPFGLRQDLSDILHIPVESIRVTSTGLGGGFGGKLYAGVESYCVLLTQRTGRPVRFAHTREEEMVGTSLRMGATVHVRTAVDAEHADDGTTPRCGWAALLLAERHRPVSNISLGAYPAT